MGQLKLYGTLHIMRKHCLSGEFIEVETVEHGLIISPKKIRNF